MSDNGQWTAPESPQQPPSDQNPQGQASFGQPQTSPQGYPQPQYGQHNYGQPQYGQPSYPQQPYPAPTGWAPPPQPGLIPLRPLSFGALLGVPFKVFRRNPRPTLGVALLLQIGQAIFSGLALAGLIWFFYLRFESAYSEDRNPIIAGAIASAIVFGILQSAFSIATSSIVQGVVSLDVTQGAIGRKLKFSQLWKLLRPRFWTLVLWTFLAGAVLLAVAAVIIVPVVLLAIWAGTALASAGGTIAIIVLVGLLLFALFMALAVWIGTKLSLVTVCIVVENRGIRESVSRSWKLTNGYFWKTFGTLALVNIIISTASNIITTPISFVFGIFSNLVSPTGGVSSTVITSIVLYLVLIAVTLVLSSISTVAITACYTLIYIDLRMRKEGLDIELIRFTEAFSGTEPADGIPNPYHARRAPGGAQPQPMPPAASSPWNR